MISDGLETKTERGGTTMTEPIDYAWAVLKDEGPPDLFADDPPPLYGYPDVSQDDAAQMVDPDPDPDPQYPWWSPLHQPRRDDMSTWWPVVTGALVSGAKRLGSAMGGKNPLDAFKYSRQRQTAEGNIK